MATLQKIRDKAGILVAFVIGASLLAFILGDFLGQGNSFSSSGPTAGEIHGHEVSLQEYQMKVDEFTENVKRNNGGESIDSKTQESIYNQAWEALVTFYIMDEQFELLGLNVSADELEDMIKGKYIDPQIQQIPIFQNPTTKAFDKTRVVTFLKNLDQDATGVARDSWLAFEKGLVQNKVSTKYNTLIQKGFYPNKLQVEDQIKANNESVNFDFIYKKYSEVKDEDVTFNEADLEAYYAANLYQFNQTESRNITYVTFDVTPSEDDIINTKEHLAKSEEEFATEADPIRYINLNSDETFVERFYAQGELPARLDTFMFAAEKGAITEIYQENNAFKIAKLIDFKQLPDSAEARHILLQASEEMTGPQALALSDSIQTLLKEGADFSELAKLYSKDAGSAIKGGDLGWFQKGQMVQPFEKACFDAEKGDIVVAESQFGLHIIEVQNLGIKSKKIELGYLTLNIEASEQTDAIAYNSASKFAGENRNKEQFEKAINELQLVPRVANSLKKSDRNIAGLESPKTLIRWAFNSEKDAISEEIFKFGDKYVVATLTEIREKGTTPFELAKTEIESLVINEKKAQLITEEFANAKTDDIDAMSSTLGTKILTADNISFNSFSIPGAGSELNVIAQAVYGAPNTVISPIEGTSGVFAIKASDKIITEKSTVESAQVKLSKEFGNRVNYQAIKAIKDAAEIVDNRLNYY